MTREYVVAIVGATGVVGQELVQVLSQRGFPVKKLLPLASERSAGSRIDFNGREVRVEKLNRDSFQGVDIALFSAGAKVSAEYAPLAVQAGAIVIDNTSHFRMDPDVPLVVPEVNAHALKQHRGIIANPNCSTAQLVLPLQAVHQHCRIRRVVVSTYQSTSGAGKAAMDELRDHAASLLNGVPAEAPVKFKKEIAFNVIPQIDTFTENGYTKEEMKMVNETKKIMGDASIKVTATTVRVPVFISHSESVNVELEKPVDIAQVRLWISSFPGIQVQDDPANGIYPTPQEAAGTDATYVGRIRRDPDHEYAFDMWIVADNLRKGAALNAVQIAESMVEQGLI